MPTAEQTEGRKAPAQRLTQAQAIELWEKNRGFMCLPTTLEDLDRGLGGGLPVHQVTTVLGPTGAGKSELARQFRRKISLAGTYVFHVDVELGPERIVERDMSQESGIPATKLRGDLCEEDLAEIAKAKERLVQNTRLFNYHPHVASFIELLNDVGRDVVETCKEERKPALVIFDSLQRLAPLCPGDNQRLQTQNLMWALETFAKRYPIAVLVISEQARPPYGKKHEDNIVSSGAESRSIEYVSDVVMGLIRRSVSSKVCHDATLPFEREIDIDVAKNRNGDVGLINSTLVFKGPCWELTTRKRTVQKSKDKGEDDEQSDD